MRATRLAVMLALLLLGKDAAPAQDSEAGRDQRWFATQEEVELADLLDACVAAFGIPLEYDRSAVSGKVRLRSGPGFTNEGIWSLTNRLLASRDLACIQGPAEQSLAIVPLNQAARLARIEPGTVEDAQAGYVKSMHRLFQVPAERVVDVMRNVLSAEGSLVQPVPDAGQILLAGLKPQVLEALSVLDLLDTPYQPMSVEEVAVRHLSPTVLVTLLERITAAMGRAGERGLRGTVLANPNSNDVIVIAPEADLDLWKARIRQFDQVEGVVTVDYTPQRFGLRETARLIEAAVGRDEELQRLPDRWRIVEDELTGTLLITTTYSRHEEIAALLNRIEGVSAEAGRTLRAIQIHQRDVDEILTLLEELLSSEGLEGFVPEGGTGGVARKAESVEAAAPAAPATLQPAPAVGLSRRGSAWDITLAKDEGANRILAIGSGRALDEIERLVATLDVKQPQVLVEVLVATLTESQTLDLTVELQKLGSSNSALFRAASLFGAGVPSVDGSALLPRPSGMGFEGVVLDPGSFSGVLRALETVSHGRSLTIPKVLVNNNQTANLDSVLQTPYTSTNASDTVATTSFGGTLDAGTTIAVTPQITDGDQLLLEYTVALSSFVGEAADPTLPPPRQENKLSSVATVPDGFTVVVGGLETETRTEGESRVPILGRIPILGALFKSQTHERARNRFFVFLRCSIMRDDAYRDLRYVALKDIGLAGVEDGWPVLEPRWIP